MASSLPLVSSFATRHRLAFAAAAVASLLTGLSNAASAQATDTAAASKPLDQSFPDKVGTYARASVKKNDAGVTGAATDSAEAKYTASSGEITWTATAFGTPEQAIAMLATTLDKLKASGAKTGQAINNAEGKVRFATLETSQGPAYCWVNKKQKNILYMVTGKAPDGSKFVEAQTTW